MRIFIVFHKYIFDDCYSSIPQDILNKHFTFIAVNDTIPKQYTLNKYNVINEWELPIYDKSFQERGYNENSAIYHVYINNLHKESNMIGFFQYDMKFRSNIVDYINNSEKEKNEKNICYCIMPRNYNFCTYESWTEPKTAEFIINDYEKFFNKKYNETEYGPLLNSYVISREVFENIMPWVIQLYDKLYPWCIKPPNCSHKGHIGTIYERVMAYSISQSNIICKELDIIHDGHFKMQSY